MVVVGKAIDQSALANAPVVGQTAMSTEFPDFLSPSLLYDHRTFLLAIQQCNILSLRCIQSLISTEVFLE